MYGRAKAPGGVRGDLRKEGGGESARGRVVRRRARGSGLARHVECVNPRGAGGGGGVM